MTKSAHDNPAPRPAGPAEVWLNAWRTPFENAGVAQLFAFYEHPVKASEQWINEVLDSEARWGHQYARSLQAADRGDEAGEQLDRVIDSWVEWRKQCWRFYFDAAERAFKQALSNGERMQSLWQHPPPEKTRHG